MQAIETTASFNENGELTIDNMPVLKNQKVRLLIMLEENEQSEWYQFSSKALSTAFSKDEPSYTLDMINEPNPVYKP